MSAYRQAATDLIMEQRLLTRVLLMVALFGVTVVGACGEDSQDSATQDTVAKLATSEISLNAIELCDVVKDIDDIDQRLAELLGGEVGEYKQEESESEQDSSQVCSTTSPDGNSSLSFSLVQGSDNATEEDVSDEELYGECLIAGRTYAKGSVGVRCPPSLRVGLTVSDLPEGGIPPSSGAMGELDELYKELMHDLLRTLDSSD